MFKMISEIFMINQTRHLNLTTYHDFWLALSAHCHTIFALAEIHQPFELQLDQCSLFPHSSSESEYLRLNGRAVASFVQNFDVPTVEQTRIRHLQSNSSCPQGGDVHIAHVEIPCVAPFRSKTCDHTTRMG